MRDGVVFESGLGVEGGVVREGEGGVTGEDGVGVGGVVEGVLELALVSTGTPSLYRV